MNSYYDATTPPSFGGQTISLTPGFTSKKKLKRVSTSTESASVLDVGAAVMEGIYRSGAETAAGTAQLQLGVDATTATLGGSGFADLLYRVASINPEVRIRFQSPHPKVSIMS